MECRARAGEDAEGAVGEPTGRGALVNERQERTDRGRRDGQRETEHLEEQETEEGSEPSSGLTV